MKVFISYSRHDDGAVRSMVGDLQRAGVQVWLDEDLGGGDAWWTEILNEIRACTVFLFALTENSLYSKPCRAELGYAQALGLPILPVQIGEVSSYRADPIFSRQLIDYRQPTAATGLALMGALDVHAAHRNELPEPLPEAPPIPYEYLQRLGASIHDPAVLAPPAQAQMLFELRNALCEEDDPTVLYDIRKLLRTLRRRADVTYPIANEIDTVLSKDAADSSQAAAKDTAMASAGQNGLGTDDDVTYTSGSHVDEETTEKRMPARDGTEAVAKSVRHDASAVSGDSGEVVATTVAATTASSTDVARPADRPDAPKSRLQVTEESRGLGSVSPTQTTSTSEKSPLLHWLKRLFHRLNRRTKIVLVAVAVIVVAAVAVVITVERQPDPTQRLLALVRSDDHCRPAQPVTGAVATVTCSPAASEVTHLAYSLFPDQGRLDGYFNTHLSRLTCAGWSGPRDWHSNKQIGGKVECYLFNGFTGVLWSINQQLLVGDVHGKAQDVFDRWWMHRYCPAGCTPNPG